MDDLENKSGDSIDFSSYFGLARRHVWHFLIPFFLGWLAVWTSSWFMPSVYRSGTLILIEEPTVPAQFVIPNIAGDLQARLQSITQQILSRTRLLHIIDQFNLYPNSKRASQDELVERMRKDIEIELIRSDDRQRLTSFNVYYSAGDPHVAQEVTSELTNLFISQNLEVRQQQSKATTGFLEDQLGAARQDLMQQEEKVREFKSRYLGQLPGQLQSNLQILSGLQNQLQAEQDALSRAKQQNSYLQSLLNQYRTLQNTARAGDSGPIGLPALDQELDRLKSQLADLSAHYTDKHPDVRKLKQQIARTERLKQQMMADLSAKKTTDSGSSPQPEQPLPLGETSPMFQVEKQLSDNKFEIDTHQRKIRQLQEQIGDYQGRLNEEPVREQQLADLTRGYDQTKADYDSLLKKKNESELATNLELQQQGEHFQILDPPSLPVKPFSPNRLKFFGIGLFVGIALGGVVSALFELSDDRMFSESQFKKLLPADVIAEIPPIYTVEEEVSLKRAGWLLWAGTGAVFACLIVALAFTYLRG